MGIQGQCFADFPQRAGAFTLALCAVPSSRGQHGVRKVFGQGRVFLRAVSSKLEITVAIQKRFDALAERQCRFHSFRGVELGCAHAQVFELWRDFAFGVPDTGPRIDPRKNGRQHRVEAALGVQRVQREDLEEHGAQGIDVRPGIHVATSGLLWRHGARGPDHATGKRRLRGGRLHDAVRDRLLRVFGHPPVEQVHVAVVAEHDVGRLDVAVHDAPLVCVVRGQAHLRKRCEQLA